MKPKPTVRKIGDHWACEWPAFGFAGRWTTYHPTWREALAATAGPGGSTGGLAERRDGLADGIGTVSPWSPLSYTRGVWTWLTSAPVMANPVTTQVWWRDVPPPPTPSGGPVPVGP